MASSGLDPILARHTRHAIKLGLVAILYALALGGCEEEVVQVGRGSSRSAAKPAAAAPAAGDAAKKEGDALSFKDDDFIESERNRDPFRAYSTAMHSLGAEADVAPQRRVIMPNTEVEQMRLLAVVSGMARPKAMLTDAVGVGYVVERGDYVGRAKVLQTSGSVQMTLNWRVDRIRETEVVLTRADPTDPTRPPLSRIISMENAVAQR